MVGTAQPTAASHTTTTTIPNKSTVIVHPVASKQAQTTPATQIHNTPIKTPNQSAQTTHSTHVTSPPIGSQMPPPPPLKK